MVEFNYEKTFRDRGSGFVVSVIRNNEPQKKWSGQWDLNP